MYHIIAPWLHLIINVIALQNAPQECMKEFVYCSDDMPFYDAVQFLERDEALNAAA